MTDDQENDLQPGIEPRGTPGERDEKGHFLPGNKTARLGAAQGGRPPGALDFVALCRKRAKEQGVDLGDLLWVIARRLFTRAGTDGDVPAAKLLIDRLCGAVEKGTGVEVLVDNRQVNVGAGPPIPKDFGRCLAELADVSKDLIEAEQAELDRLLG